MRLIWLILLTSLPCVVPASAVSEYQLGNGLKLVVKTDHRAPVVTSQIWYRVGSSYEYDGITGISHALEHMMFKGTHEYPSGEFARIVAENGGEQNAFTGRDYTAYYQKLEKDRLEISFELEADRMRNQLLVKHELEREMDVIKEERRLRTEDRPQALVEEYFMATAFTSGPYRTPIIGWMSDLESLELQDLEDWYRRWYAPNNATVVVAGDVEPKQVYALARKWFGPLQASELTPPKPRPEVPQLGERRITLKLPAKVPYLVMGYKVPVLKGAETPSETYALEVLAWILDGGESARLPRNLVRGQQVAASAKAGYKLHLRLPELFLLKATPAAGHSAGELERALRAEIRRLQEEVVPEAELNRVKTQAVAHRTFSQDSVFYQAQEIGKLESVGLGWAVMEDYVPSVRAVTSGQVRAAARKYLVDDRLTVAVLEPQPMGPGKRRVKSSVGGRHVR